MTSRSRRLSFGPVFAEEKNNQPVTEYGLDESPNCCKKCFTPFHAGWNRVAYILHLISAVVMIVFAVEYREVNIPLTESFLKWNNVTDLVANSSNVCGPNADRRVDTRTSGVFCIENSTRPTGTFINLALLVIFFHILSFFFQALADFTSRRPLCGYSYEEIVKAGRNPLRFIEYGASASIMLIAIALLNGIRDVDMIAAIGVLTAATQMCGLVVEFLTEDKQLPLKWILHLTGWMQFFCAYGIITHSFALAATAVEGVEPPAFVHIIVIVLFLLYASFGFVQLVEMLIATFGCTPCDCCWCKPCCGNCYFEDNKKSHRIDPECKENTFVFLSLGAKIVLGWMIFANVLIVSRNDV